MCSPENRRQGTRKTRAEPSFLACLYCRQTVGEVMIAISQSGFYKIALENYERKASNNCLTRIALIPGVYSVVS
jgi:hypothetical protein